MGGLARTGNKEEKEETSQRFEGKKKACPESWSSFKDFKVDENFYCSIFGPWPILLTFLSTKWKMLKRGMLELTSALDQFLPACNQKLNTSTSG